MADSVFHKDFKSMPWWWEWWHPTNELSQDPPRKTDVLVVGAGYGGLSTALELARSGVEVTVLERGEFGVGASTRNGGGVSGGTTLGKGFSGKGVGGDPEEWKKIMPRMLADAADSLAQVADGDRARGHRVPLAHERPLQRRLHAAPLRRAGGQGRHLQCERRPRHLHGPARAAARGDRLGLLLRRHGGGAHRPAPSRALLRRPAEGGAPRRREALRPVRRREDRAQASGRRLHACSPTRGRSRRARS